MWYCLIRVTRGLQAFLVHSGLLVRVFRERRYKKKKPTKQTYLYLCFISHLLHCALINVCLHRAIWAKWELQAPGDSPVLDWQDPRWDWETHRKRNSDSNGDWLQLIVLQNRFAYSNHKNDSVSISRLFTPQSESVKNKAKWKVKLEMDFCLFECSCMHPDNHSIINWLH